MAHAGLGGSIFSRASCELFFYWMCRICNLLDALSEATDKPTFFYALWHSILGSPDYRLPAVNLLLTKLNRKLSAEDQVHCIGGNLSLVVSRGM